jgi:hypothetical protein
VPTDLRGSRALAWRKYATISMIGMICFAKPGLTEDLYIVHKEEFSVTCYICNTYTCRKAKKRQTHLLARGDVA